MQVCVFLFDCLHADGGTLVQQPLAQRRRRLAQALPNLTPGRISMASSVEFDSAGRPVSGDAALLAALRAAALEEGGAALQPLVNGTAARTISNEGTPQEPAGRDSAAGGEGGQSGQRGEAVECAGASNGAGTSGSAAQALPAATTTAVNANNTVSSANGNTAAEAAILALLVQAVAAGTEGLMLKRMSAAYEPSRRSESWIKVKKDYCEGLRDSIDVVPIGAWTGQGRKVRGSLPFKADFIVSC